MHKLAKRSRNGHGESQRQLKHLELERRRLTALMSKVEQKIHRLDPNEGTRVASVDALDRWFDEMTEGLPNLPPLPADFSRADIYDDHD